MACRLFARGASSSISAPSSAHIGVYPPVTTPAELVEALTPFRGPKGNLAFPHRDSLPLDLIGRVARALAAQYGS
jgi:hypothetical protein